MSHAGAHRPGGGTLTGELTLLGGSERTVMGEFLIPAWGRSGRTLWWGGRFDSSDVSGETSSSWRRSDLFPYLYLLSAWDGGVTLRSESESDTGLRGREAEEVGRDVDQVGTTGEDRGFGSVDTPDRDLEESSKATSQPLPSNLEVVLENILFPPHRLFPHNWISWSISAQ